MYSKDRITHLLSMMEDYISSIEQTVELELEVPPSPPKEKLYLISAKLLRKIKEDIAKEIE